MHQEVADAVIRLSNESSSFPGQTLAAVLNYWNVTRHAVSDFRARCPLMDSPRTTGVYCLMDRDEVVYIGQSKDLAQRLLTHIGNNSPDYIARVKPFDHIAYIEVPRDRLRLVEHRLIRSFMPRGNVGSSVTRKHWGMIRMDDLCDALKVPQEEMTATFVQYGVRREGNVFDLRDALRAIGASKKFHQTAN
jgi:hypothetical protein